jgi:mRNA-degrading endonuclease toxin of MazEF toxin-antitoxin module
MQNMTEPFASIQSRRRTWIGQEPSHAQPFAVRTVDEGHVARPSELRRGDIWTIDFGPEIGNHPALLVSRTGSMRRRWRAVVALITSEGIGLPTEVTVGPRHGLTRDSVIDCEDLYTVATDDVKRRVGDLDPDTQDAVDRALVIALGLRV